MNRRRWFLAALWLAVLAMEFGAVRLMTQYAARDNLLLDLLVTFAAVTAGVIALDQRPGNPIGWLMVAMAITWSINPYVDLDVPALTVLAFVLNALNTAVVAHLLLAYPDGRLQTRYEGGVVIAIYLGSAAMALAELAVYSPRDWGCETCAWFPAPWPSRSAYDAVGTVGSIQTAFLAALFVVAVALRYRRSSRIERIDLAPLWICAVLLAVFETIGFVAEDPWEGFMRFLWQVRSVALTAIPLVFLYGLLTRRTASSAVGTLVLRLREGVRPGHLGAVLADCLGDPSLRLFYSPTDGGGWTSTDGVTVDDLESLEDRNHAITLIERDGRPYAAMVHDRAVDQRLVRGVASGAAMSLENEWLHTQLRVQLDEVRASRSRILAAGDRERRRVERDLHDGAQQRLLALSMALRSARHELETTAPAARSGALDAAEVQLHLAIEELRELARGIHPTILTDAGLGAAIGSLAGLTTIPVDVTLDLPAHLPAPVEAAAYFAVGECLANVAKHAAAGRAEVVGHLAEGVLCLRIADDGVGGAAVGVGTGLSGLLDRLAAVDGRLVVTSPVGAGTMVAIHIPVPDGATR